MTQKEIIETVKRLEPWFHSIDLGAGIRTKTASVAGEPADHPRTTWARIREHLPEDLAGKDLIDVGCNAGFYAVEAKRRGARRVLGVDAQRFHVRQARFVAETLNLEIEYQRMSVYDLDPHIIGQFDVTLALGLLYHCKHPVLALERLARVTRGMMILETAILPGKVSPGSQDYRVGDLMRTIHPAAFVENPAEAKEEVYNWFLPSVECLEGFLRNTGFHRIASFAHGDERAIIVCHKREAYPDSRSLSHLGAALTLLDGSAACRPAEEIRFRIRAENTGYARWLADGEAGTGKGAVRLAAHILSAAGEELAWYCAAASLPGEIAPGESAQLDIRVRAPEAPGFYMLEFNMVAEHLAWFDDLGSLPLVLNVEVIG